MAFWIAVLFESQKTHLPGFIKNFEQVKAKGYEVIACVTVNDPFVTAAWGKSAQATNKVRILADPTAEFTKVSFHLAYSATAKEKNLFFL